MLGCIPSTAKEFGELVWTAVRLVYIVLTGTFSHSINDKAEIDDVSDLMARAREAERATEWGLAAVYYSKAIDLLDEKTDSLEIWSEKEDAKHRALTCWLGRLHCTIEARRNPDIAHHDMGSEVRKGIKNTEREIKRYKIQNKRHLWNTLESHYDRWEKESVQQGRDYEASEFCYAMMRARRLRLRATGHLGVYIRLTMFDYLVGFGHRLGRPVFWILAIIVVFSIPYYIGYSGLVASSETHNCPLLASVNRYIDSLCISTFMLFAPERLHLQQGNAIVEIVLSFQALLAYIVNAGLIALLVNVLSSRRKW